MLNTREKTTVPPATEAVEKVRRELKRASVLEREINEKCERCEKLRTLCQNLSVPPGHAGLMEKLTGLETELIDEVEELADEIERARARIGTLTDDSQRTVLEAKYLGYRTFDDIAERLNYCRRHVVRLHLKGLEELALRESQLSIGL